MDGRGRAANPLAHVFQVGGSVVCEGALLSVRLRVVKQLVLPSRAIRLPTKLARTPLPTHTKISTKAIQNQNQSNPSTHTHPHKTIKAIGEDLELIKYNTWNVVVPEGQFLTKIGNNNFYQVRVGSWGGRVRKWACNCCCLETAAAAASVGEPVTVVRHYHLTPTPAPKNVITDAGVGGYG